MSKIKTDYFELIEKQTSYCVKAANLLEGIMREFNPEIIDAYREEMHGIEHAADEIHHDILKKLSTEFITPIDQEDILRLVQIIDDITDALDEVVLELYMYHVTATPERAVELATIVNRCVNALHEAATELKNFKKSRKLRDLLVGVNDIEVEGDVVYLEAVYDLFEKNDDMKTLLSSKSVYEGLEHCCDLCEDAADIIEQLVIKNT